MMHIIILCATETVTGFGYLYFYVQFAKREEREVLVMFGEEYKNYLREIPGFIPQFKSESMEA